jgi:hypothetical protein
VSPGSTNNYIETLFPPKLSKTINYFYLASQCPQNLSDVIEPHTIINLLFMLALMKDDKKYQSLIDKKSCKRGLNKVETCCSRKLKC